MDYLAGIKPLGMDELDKAKFKDDILRHLEPCEFGLSAYQLYSKFQSMDYSSNMFEKILEEIHDYDPLLIELETLGHHYAQKTSHIAPFLKKGGFVGILENKNRAKALEISKKRKQEKRSAILDFTKIAGILISIPVSLISLWLTLKENPKENESRLTEINTKLESQNDSIWNAINELKSIKDTIN